MPVNIPTLDQPTYFYRQHENDIMKPENPKTTFDQFKRVASVALPVASYLFYSVLGTQNVVFKSLAAGMNGLRASVSLAEVQKGRQTGNASQVASGALKTTLSVGAVVASVFAPTIGLFLSTSNDLTSNLGSLIHANRAGDSKIAAEMGAKIVLSSLYLGTFFVCSSGLWTVLSSAQVLQSLYASADDLQKGNHLEAGGNMFMALLRLPQLAISAYEYQNDWDCKDCDLD
jgi:hypothetical protein